MDEFVKFYEATLRQPLFTGFLTLSGFLLSATTFIVMQMKKELYERQLYLDEVERLRAASPSLKTYAPLQRLSWLLIGTLVISLITSAWQFTFGVLWRHYGGGAIVGCVLAAIAFVAIFFCLVQMFNNLNTWFTYLEKEADKKIADAKTAAAATTTTSVGGAGPRT
ncbi:hypothetical protein [Anatilimnocola floriformis]|uniref:hypothetical protein n=1 Tax=Anatilimnocola floriformis TaxID=2948575 RepID=UPI0020C369FC|nr:hypothetical protein [Anatilimnocola floriformis]